MDDATFDAAMKARREVLGDDYVDRALGDQSPAGQEFQRYIADVAWSRWIREGLGRKERSLVTLAMTIALNRMDEFALHLRASRRVGVTDAELEELMMQIVAYCGAPAGINARKAVLQMRAEEAAAGG